VLALAPSAPRRSAERGRARPEPSVPARFIRGAVVGGGATWLMDLVTTGIQEGQSEDVTRREKAARPNGRGAVANLIARIEAGVPVSLSDEQRQAAEAAVHYGLGVLPGALYATLRHRVPLLGAGRGVVYGLLLWALNDEYLNTKLELAAPPEAYPVETHWRGLVGHVVLGVATDTGLDLLRA
jgi:hypothetical protein